MSPIAVGVASAVAAGYYLNHKYQFGKDWEFLRAAIGARRRMESIIKQEACSLYDRFDDQCQIRPFAVALAHWYVSKGIQPRDRVAMMLYNSPMFIITWLALLKIKVVPVFINSQIAGPALIHSLKIADAKLLVFDYELIPVIQESLVEIQDLGYDLYTITPKHQVHGQLYGHLPEDVRQVINVPSYVGFVEWQHLSPEGFPKSTRKDIDVKEAAALIYTSGTTGFPKATVMDHGRCNMATGTWGVLCQLKPASRSYVTLPLYHSAGAIIGVAVSWVSGNTVILSRKFSTTRFWKDCVDYDVTHIQYIGELCRYLLNAPPSPLDRKHKITMAYGNGMRPDIWGKFQERFNIPTCFEFYTLSEGCGALTNIARNKRDQGAVGFRGPIISLIQPGLRLVKVDMETEELTRDKKTGFCIPCGPNEIGELVILADNKHHHTRYLGYFNQPKMSQAKLVQNVHKKGDIYMRTGDLLYRNKDHYWYFADRAGDTYRWKSENVSTAEVADTLGRVEGLASCTVYGVSIPGHDGRAGMAALVLKDEIKDNEASLEDFVRRIGVHAGKYLPAYAVPRFLRICDQELETTGTFKNMKMDLKKEGVDLEKINERMYWWTSQGRYLPFGQAENEQILSGRARL
ncbi:hypothetical protein BG011_006593 [Mortierella polycephala]|uniref:Uncharacterized protein n=1 Tax=Mortierella polycephala TaxID=41804 RepID=A0A9P6PU41_9FUNG|nr:hypothetical protein BG011_006593 [Mortierella polycephala]